MKNSTIKIILYSLIIIFIFHYFIKLILLREKIYKFRNKYNNNNNLFNQLPNLNIENFTNHLSDNITITNDSKNIKNDLNNESMKEQLLQYMNENQDIYNENTDIYLKEKETILPPPSNIYKNDYSIPNFQTNNHAIDKYFEPVVNITNEIDLPNQVLPKKKNIDPPTICIKDKIPKNNNQNSTILWEYNDENIMNGAEIKHGLYGWDSATNQQYADIDIKPTIIPCSNN